MTNTTTYDVFPFFEDVQMSHIFPDGKTFVDCLPKKDPDVIITNYSEQRKKSGFTLEKFIHDNFELPVPHSNHYTSDRTRTVEDNIDRLWDVLTRQPDKKGGTLIPLPYPYIVPGGRFGEIYYWDSYFTMLGLKAAGRNGMVENMVNNFSYLIDTLGYIPNGNRSYFLGRSQPPFYSLMVKLLAGMRGPEILLQYLPQLQREYDYWMTGAEQVGPNNPSAHHIVLMPGGEIMNRYWDEHDSPRPESYSQDVKLAELTEQPSPTLYRHLRAGAESGWDYSCRWFKDTRSFASIHTTEIMPVDLNCLLWHLEQTLSDAYRLKSDAHLGRHYHTCAERRKAAIQQYCWNAEQHFYVDYDIVAGCQKECLTLAGIAPLYFFIATNEQAKQVAAIIKERFLFDGGLVSTLESTGQQWDAPNGWAPLHWMTIRGFENYGFDALASDIATRWIRLNTDVFKRTGKLMEKYNVINTHLEAGGGEYSGQDGFGWTNGVLLALIKKYGSCG